MKTCNVCSIEKELIDYPKRRDSKDGTRNTCSKCLYIKYKYQHNINSKRYRIEHKEELAEYFTGYYNTNKNDIKKYKSDYYLKNKDQIVSKRKKYNKENISAESKAKKKIYTAKYNIEWFAKNPHVKAWRAMLYSCLHRMKTTKSASTIEMLGYSADDLKRHFESLFVDGMSWDNHGEWHIDHIKPISLFTPDTPMNIVNALSNLRPLWAFENLSKHDKY